MRIRTKKVLKDFEQEFGNNQKDISKKYFFGFELLFLMLTIRVITYFIRLFLFDVV